MLDHEHTDGLAGAKRPLGSYPVDVLIEDGICVGAVVRRADGTESVVRAKSAVLATGGCGAAPDLFAELDGAPLVSAAATASTGDGLEIARRHVAPIRGPAEPDRSRSTLSESVAERHHDPQGETMPALDPSIPTAWADAFIRWGIVHEHFSAPDPDPYGTGDWLPKT